MGERARGAVLYTCAGLVLAGGGWWWVRAAPGELVDPKIEQWQQNAVRLLPDADDQDTSGTVALAAGAEQEVVADGGDGSFMVAMICVGGEGSGIRISLSDTGDSGHGLDCANDHTPYRFEVSVPDQLRMNVVVNDSGPAVFRYSLTRTAD